MLLRTAHCCLGSEFSELAAGRREFESHDDLPASNRYYHKLPPASPLLHHLSHRPLNPASAGLALQLAADQTSSAAAAAAMASPTNCSSAPPLANTNHNVGINNVDDESNFTTLDLEPNSFRSSDSSTSSSSAAPCTSGIAWKDVWVTVQSRGQSRAVLHGLSGYAEPGKILAIMGPSGSGKSTLLDALAGRLGRHARLSGQIVSLNGSSNRKKSAVNGKAIAYVTQDDTLLGTLTVRETITYSANLRLPASMSSSEKQEMVEKTILDMGLSDSADTPVGNWHLRGLSGGEKRRLSIALEILTRPNLLFLDEPTSGLDSASAYFVIATLRRLAREGGRTLVASIHQPSSEVFALFDSLFLLSSGRTVYFGDRALASEHFGNAGFPCPSHRNPSDHYLCAINSDFDKVKSSVSMDSDLEASAPLEQLSSTQMTEILVENYTKSKYSEIAKSRAEEMISKRHQETRNQPRKIVPPSFFDQTLALTRRSFVNMRRDVGYYWLRLVIYIMLTTCIGSIYFKIGTHYESIMARASCISYVTGFLTFMSIGGFPSFIEDMKVFTREHSNGHYGVLPFVFSNFISSLPFLTLISVISGSMCYYMVELHPGFSHFAYFVLCLLACLSVVESLMMAVASVVPNFLMGIITGAGIQGIFMLVAGFFRLPNDMPKPVWRYPMSYMSFHMYAMQGMYQNDFLGLEFKANEEWAPPVPGRFILEKMYQINLNRSKWWDLAVLVAMIVGYRILFWVMIKASESMRKFIIRLGASKSNVGDDKSSIHSSSSSSSPSRTSSEASSSLESTSWAPNSPPLPIVNTISTHQPSSQSTINHFTSWIQNTFTFSRNSNPQREIQNIYNSSLNSIP